MTESADTETGVAQENEIVWEFECRCGEELSVPASETDFSPTSLGLPECDDCGEYMRHVGPVLDECDKCDTPLLYNGCSVHAFGLETVCEGCYDRMAEVV